MVRVAPFVALALSVAVAGGCVVPAASGPAGPDAETVLSGQRPGQVLPAAGGSLIGHAGGNLIGHAGGNIIAAGGGNVVARMAAGVVAREGAAIEGTVQAPAGIIATGGGNLIGHAGGNIIAAGGGNIIAAGGGNMRGLLAAIDQAPVPGRAVFLMDARGQVVVGDDGKPLTAITDAEGRYAFRGFVPTRHLIVAIELHEGNSLVQAVLPKEGSRADLDLVSAITTAYIRDRYLKDQPDPAATLDKLPADVDRQTREKAAAALATATVETPATLEPAVAVAMAEALRRQDPAFDRQMETVKALLIAAGQSNMGEGRPGTEVAIGRVRQLVAGPDGLYIACPADRRVWRLGADGKLVTVVGSGAGTAAASLAGLNGPEAAIGEIVSAAIDDQGRLLLLDTTPDGLPRLTRLGADGRLSELHVGRVGGVNLKGIVAGPGEEVWLLSVVDELHALDASGQLRVLHRFQAPGHEKVSRPIHQAAAFGRDAAGNLAISYYVDAGRSGDAIRNAFLFRYDAAAKGLTEVDRTVEAASPLTYRHKGLALASGGQYLTLGLERQLRLHQPDGRVETVLPKLPDGWWFMDAPAAVGADGAVYLALTRENLATSGTGLGVGNEAVVYRVRDGAIAPVAGTMAAPAGGAFQLALTAPGGVLPVDGGLLVADKDAHTILRVGADGKSAPFAGTGTAAVPGAPAGDGGPATEAALMYPTRMQRDAAGNVYVLEKQGNNIGVERIRKIDPTGRIATAWTAKSDAAIQDFVVAPDGTILLTTFRFATLEGDAAYFQTTVRRLRPGAAAPEALFDLPAPATDDLEARMGHHYLALAPNGTLYVGGSRALRAWNEGQAAPTVVKEDARLLFPSSAVVPPMGADGAGRVYLGLQDTVFRFDPAAGTLEAVAGAGGQVLAGTGVDESLNRPASPVFDAAGDMYLADTGHKQIKRVPVSAL